MKALFVLILALVFAPAAWGDLPPPDGVLVASAPEWSQLNALDEHGIKSAATIQVPSAWALRGSTNPQDGGPLYGSRLVTHHHQGLTFPLPAPDWAPYQARASPVPGVRLALACSMQIMRICRMICFETAYDCESSSFPYLCDEELQYCLNRCTANYGC